MQEDLLIKDKKEKLLLRSRRAVRVFWVYIFMIISIPLLKLFLKVEDKVFLLPLAGLIIIIGYGFYLQVSLCCPYCNFKLWLVSRLGIPPFCPKCNNRLKEFWWERVGVKEMDKNIQKGDWRFSSQKTIFGLPLVDIAGSTRQLSADGKDRRTARGIIAIGDIAVGIIAIGRISLGVISVGSLAGGIFSIGAGAVGLFAIGGISIGGIAIGGIAMGILAGGGLAVGKYAFGGLVLR